MSKTTKKIAYKGFNKDMTCRDFQYEQGKEYIHNGDIKVCDKGFHACENPIDVFSYYAPGNSVYHQVEQSGEIVKHEDKTCSSKIKIGARIGIAGICKATFNYVKSHCTNENNAEAGKPATAQQQQDTEARQQQETAAQQLPEVNQLLAKMVYPSHAETMLWFVGDWGRFLL